MELMELKINKSDMLNKIDTELIGNGGKSRLDIMLNLENGEVFTNEFFNHEENTWKEYHDKNIVVVGEVKNSIIVDDEGVEDKDNKCWWSVEILGENGNVEVISGDYYNDYLDIDNILELIKENWIN